MTRLAHALALLLAVSATANAQEIAGNFDQLRVLVKPGDILTITDVSGVVVRGTLVDLSPSSLALDVSGVRRMLEAVDVDTVEKRGSDSLKNGTLIGLAIGAGLFGTAIGVTSHHWGYAAAGAAVYGGLGAGIGAGIDALIEGRRVIYAGSRSTGTRISVAPILSRSHKGVLLTIGIGR